MQPVGVTAKMASLKKLTGGQLEKILANTKAEIKRREHVQAATAEIRAVLRKYKMTIQDIDLQAFNKKAAGKTARTGKAQSRLKSDARDNRKRVKAKYANPKGAETWSGRGRPPAWVIELCQKYGIELAAFKKDSRFSQS